MRANRTSGLMSGEGKRSDAAMADATAPFLDSTRFSQKRPEAADSLDSRTSAKNSVFSEASSATLQNPGLWLAQTEAAYWL
jgi:hypothetical protein